MKIPWFSVVVVILRLAALGAIAWSLVAILVVLSAGVVMDRMQLMPVMLLSPALIGLCGAILWVISRSLAHLMTRDLD